MLCDVVLYFVVVFSDGHKENRVKWTDHLSAGQLVFSMMHYDEMKSFDKTFDRIEGALIEAVKPYDCLKGPTDEKTTKSK